MAETTLLPHQQRVVEEKAELDVKVKKLAEFLAGEMPEGVTNAEQGRLQHQHSIMEAYSNILDARIKAF